MSDLNPEQRQAVEYMGKHVLVLAGAGTGKTKTIVSRAAHLIKSGVDPDRILMLTFTRRSATQMKDRLLGLVGDSAIKLHCGTFHRFCLHTMKTMPNLFDMEDLTLLDRDDQVQLFKLARGARKEEDLDIPKAAGLTDLYSYARNTNQPSRDYLEKFTDFAPELIDVVLDIFGDYTSRKKRHGYMDYDDILYRFAKYLHSSETVRNIIKAKFDHILVDEMQDTNPLQWLILEGMYDPAFLFVVGDDAQSIYAFRGADFNNVHLFKDKVENSVILKLEKNYRSYQEILDLSNWLLDKSPLQYDKHLIAHRENGDFPVIRNFNNEFEEARWIADDLLQRHSEGADWNEHMVITRTGFAARKLEAVMVEKKIPYMFIGGTSLMESAHIKDFFALVRSALSLSDELAWIRYLTLWPRIGDAKASKLIAKIEGQSTIQGAIGKISEDIGHQMPLIEGLKLAANNPKPVDVISKCAEFFNTHLSKNYERWNVRKKDFKLLSELAVNYKDMASFIETYTLDPISTSEVSNLEEDDCVTLITVHSAKGTESPVCYLIKAEAGMYPHTRSLGSEEEIEEERRILYVAMTRAQNELIITRSPFATPAYGTNIDHSDTYFLSEVPSYLARQEALPERSNNFSYQKRTVY